MTRRGRSSPHVLLDTGPLYALLDSGDGKHPAAVKLFEELEALGAEISCAYPAALEAHRLMLTRQRVTVEHAHALICDALEVFGVVVPTLEDAEMAQSNLKRFNDQKITLTDATIAAMARRKRNQIVTFDKKQRHFELMGATVYEGQR